MKLDKLGNYIKLIDNRNRDETVRKLFGVSINKKFIPSVANIIGTDLNSYKIIKEKQFACSLMQVSRDGGIAVSIFNRHTDGIVSPAYYVFEANTDKILPDYLNMIFNTSEFDRQAVFYAIGGVRGTLTWEEFCNLEINVPELKEQQEIVDCYKKIENREKVLNKLNENLEKLIKMDYYNNTHFFKGNKIKIKIGDYCNIFTGKKDVNQSLDKGKYKFYSCSPESFFSDEYIYDGEAILVAGNGSYTGRTIFVDESFDLYQRTYAITAKNNSEKYLYIIYAILQTDFQDLDLRELHGSAIPYIVLGDLSEMTIEINEDIEKISNTIKSLLYNILDNKRELEVISKLKQSLCDYIS